MAALTEQQAEDSEKWLSAAVKMTMAPDSLLLTEIYAPAHEAEVAQATIENIDAHLLYYRTCEIGVMRAGKKMHRLYLYAFVRFSRLNRVWLPPRYPCDVTSPAQSSAGSRSSHEN